MVSSVALGLAVGVVPAHADIVVTDWKTQGDGLLLWDTQTNLQWLNLTVTQGQSFDAVTSQLGSAYQGFKFATTDAVWTLFAHAEVSPSYPAPKAAAQALATQWGTTLSTPGNYFVAAGIIADENPYMPGYQLVAGVGSVDLGNDVWFANATFGAQLPDQPLAWFGSALVRDYVPLPVPEASTWSLMLLGLLPVVLRSRRRPQAA
ncbi:MAG: hypothetical protein DI603_20915 [Roseateles depolymerans]|uniref:PEP-CTERM protein-sorting domain-containing protein n=1 Tax=Roseateles depolymerans TaxID=76731 RepID=A0A2W5FDS6_9BURK|nr:MAG: hypothetical protein DI603_20915 [Roseateles depolymerans]